MGKKRVLGVIFLMILLGAGFYYFFDFEGESESEELEACVPASCCHADSCVWETGAPNCSGIMCTMSCEPGTMDCGQGHCEVIEGNCEVAWDEE